VFFKSARDIATGMITKSVEFGGRLYHRKLDTPELIVSAGVSNIIGRDTSTVSGTLDINCPSSPKYQVIQPAAQVMEVLMYSRP